MQEFSKQMKEGGEEPKLTSISLAISVLAVLVAMVTVLGHRSHTEAVLVQSAEGDQWNQYQAKKNREENMQLDVDMLQLQPTLDAKARDAKVAEYRVSLAKWNDQLPQEQAKAEELEREVARAESRAGRFDLGDLGGAVVDYPVYAAAQLFCGWTIAGSRWGGGSGFGVAGEVRQL